MERIQACLAGLWAGVVIGVGGIAAPSLFLALDRAQAGKGAGQVFAIEARVSLALAIVLFLLERRRSGAAVEQGRGRSVMTPEILLILAALFFTVFGYFALQPMMAAAKAGQLTPLSFGAVHGLSAAMFWLKGLALVTLTWRLSAAQRTPAAAAAASA